jgi:outer membrane protein OmpA-like peptidoglycan-associated protein
MRRRLGIVAALLCSTSGVAMAQLSNYPTPAIAPASFYVGIFGGAAFPLASHIDGPQVPSGSRATWDTGFVAGGAVGYMVGNGLRVELEGAYRESGISQLYGVNASSGRISNITAMGNVLYDINTGTFVTPYVGGGIGVSYAQVRANPAPSATPQVFFGDHDVVLAYQAIAGLSFQVTPAIALGVDYRFFGTMDPRIAASTAPNLDHDFTNQQHTVTASIRYLFGQVPSFPPVVEPAPPQPPPPATVSRPAQQAFLIFFDFNRSNLRPDAMATIQQAAQVVLAGGTVRMTLTTGHTDTVGSVQYNIGLSQRRADVVRNALVQLGVPASTITTRALGKSQLLVPTPDQTREAQNRRAEIVVQ